MHVYSNVHALFGESKQRAQETRGSWNRFAWGTYAMEESFDVFGPEVKSSTAIFYNFVVLVQLEMACAAIRQQLCVVPGSPWA